MLLMADPDRAEGVVALTSKTASATAGGSCPGSPRARNNTPRRAHIEAPF